MEHWKWHLDVSVQKMRALVPDSLHNSGSRYRFHLASSACSPGVICRNTLPQSKSHKITVVSHTEAIYDCNSVFLWTQAFHEFYKSTEKLNNLTCVPHFAWIWYTSCSFPLAWHTKITVARQRNQWLTLQVPHAFTKVSSNWNNFLSCIFELWSS